MLVFLEPVHLWSEATYAKGGYRTAVSFTAKRLAVSWIHTAQRNVKCSANLYPQLVMRYQLMVTGVDQSATCRPRKLKGDPWPCDQSRCSYQHVWAFSCITTLNFSKTHMWLIQLESLQSGLILPPSPPHLIDKINLQASCCILHTTSPTCNSFDCK